MHVLTLADALARDLPRGVVVLTDIPDPAQAGRWLVRKGELLDAPAAKALAASVSNSIRVLEPDRDDVLQEGASRRLAAAAAGSGARPDPAPRGICHLVATHRGLVHIRADLVEAYNREPDVLLFTGPSDQAVEAGAVLGGVKLVQLLVPEEVLARAAARGPVMTVAPFQRQEVALLVSGRDASADLARDVEALRARLDRFGSTLRWDDRKPVGDAALRSAFASAREASLGLIVVIGGSVTDPADPVLSALRAAGGRVERLGLPFEPGTAGWIGRLASASVLGLPTSGFFGRHGPLDLLLPWVLTGAPVTPALLGRLASRGLMAAHTASSS